LNNKIHKKIVLASTSGYRKTLLERLQLAFTIVAPDADETPLHHERCADTAARLSVAKAYAGAIKCAHDDAYLIIGSDQVADLNGVTMGKPGTVERAFAQLQSMRNQTVIFHTGLALLNTASQRLQKIIVPTTVTMRDYSDDEIRYYLAHENALDCAGSAKSEGLGTALIASQTSDDPTALIGLPLIALTTMLANEGVMVLS
jgi:septum formation protein